MSVCGSYNVYGSTTENMDTSELVRAVKAATSGLHDFMYMDSTLSPIPAVLLGGFGILGGVMSYECLRAKNTAGMLASTLVTLGCVGCIGYAIYAKNQRTHEITTRYFQPLETLFAKDR